MSQAQRGGFFPQGENLWEERAEDHRQDPEAQDQGEERAQSREGGRREERDVYSVYIMCHVFTLYPKPKFTSEFSLTTLKKLLCTKESFLPHLVRL